MIEMVIVGLLLLGLLLSLIRFFIGPTPQDRVLALDVITVQSSAFLVYWSLSEGVGHYIDVVLIIAAAIFLTTILFARYFERGLK